MPRTWPDDCKTGGERTKCSFWYTKFLENYSVNMNFSPSHSLLFFSHLAMYQALLYLKINLTVCLFTHSKGIKIGPSYQEISGVSKFTLAMNNPVWRCWLNFEIFGPLPPYRIQQHIYTITFMQPWILCLLFGNPLPQLTADVICACSPIKCPSKIKVRITGTPRFFAIWSSTR